MGPNFQKFTVSANARSRRRGGGTINLVENSQLVKILSFRSYGLLASFYFQKVQQPKILSPLAKVVADTPVNLHSEGFCCPFSIWLEPVRVEILDFLLGAQGKRMSAQFLNFTLSDSRTVSHGTQFS